MPKQKTNRRVERISREMLEAFRTRNVPRSLGQIYLSTPSDRVPSSKWSVTNRFLAAMHGHIYAATYNQWQELGRQVRRGESAFSIIVPITRIAREDDPERGIEEGDRLVVGFSTCPVFGYEQTDGEPLEELEANREFIETLPLVEVAHHWELQVTPFSGRGSRALGVYTAATQIGLGVENLATWAHELVHAADDRLGLLDFSFGRPEAEIVAEFGGAVLLEVIGYPEDSDRGGAYEYITRHAEEHGVEPTRAISQLLTRIFACLDLILTTATEIGAWTPNDESGPGISNLPPETGRTSRAA